MIIGIDLGTTNSAVAVFRDGEAQLIPNAIGARLTPSAVSIGDDGRVLVGMAARDRKATHADATATAFKRMMGTQAQATLARKRYSAEQLSALVLGALKADAEAALGEAVTQAVVTVPAYFNDRQRKATRRAGELAGLTVERLLNEPTAAALAHGLADRDDEAPFLVFDLGGGTFDVSIVQIIDGIVEVRASAGDVRLGGEDFNEVLVQMARERLPAALKREDRDPGTLRALFESAAERTRRTLSDANEARFDLVIDDTAHGFDVSADEFEAAAEPLLARLREPVLRSLRDSNLRADDLGEIVLVGGGTRMPVVRRAVTRMFGRFPATGVNPDEAVALGAAIQAGLKAKDAALDEIRLTDVCPFTLGVDVSERDSGGRMHTGIFSPIIERNTIVPASRVESFSTMQDGQRQVQFNIFQGEARDVTHNVKLGSIKVPVPAKPAGHVSIDCRFSYDASGMLEVDVSVPETGVTRQVTIIDDADAPSEKEMDQRRAALAALKVHPREESANAATIARLERCYQHFLGDYRTFIGDLTAQFDAALGGQDPRVIAEVRAGIEAQLDGLEGERFL